MYIDLGGSQAASKNSKSSIQVIQHFLFKMTVAKGLLYCIFVDC